MNLPYPHFQINFKVYPATWGEDALSIAQTISRVQEETNAQFVLTPQIPDLRRLATETDLTLTAPRMDATEPGRGMGKILPEALAAGGADGVVMNHAEDRDTLADLSWKIERCRTLGMDSVICVDSIEMGQAVTAYDPDAVIYEKPDDIGSDRAITRTHPDRVREFIEMIEQENQRTRVLVGGGITTGRDVERAFELGADASGAASTVSLADDLEETLREIAAGFPTE